MNDKTNEDRKPYPRLDPTTIVDSAVQQRFENRNRRLRRLDTYNWVIEKWLTPGVKQNGKLCRGKWKVYAYYPKLEQAAERLFDDLVLNGEEVPELGKLVRNVEQAKSQILKEVKAVLSRDSKLD